MFKTMFKRMIKTFKEISLAIRPKTLSAALVPVAVISAYSFNGNWWILICAIGASLCLQISSNLFNDAIDFKKGADTNERLGPTRISQSGRLSYSLVIWFGIFFSLVAFLFGLYLIYIGGLPILAIGLLSILFAYLYTGGPFPLAYNGLGELFVLLFFGWAACIGLNYLYTLSFDMASLIIGTQLGLMCSVLIAINNLRDIETDKVAKKNTLAVIFGKTFARYKILSFYSIGFLLQIYWYYRLGSIALIPLVVFPFAILLVRDIFKTEPSKKYNLFLARSSLTYSLFGLLYMVMFYANPN